MVTMRRACDGYREAVAGRLALAAAQLSLVVLVSPCLPATLSKPSIPYTNTADSARYLQFPPLRDGLLIPLPHRWS